MKTVRTIITDSRVSEPAETPKQPSDNPEVNILLHRTPEATLKQNVTPQTMDHYENFPVASVLCPARLRPPIAAIYWFARTADDIADEGSAWPEHRLVDLAEFRADLAAVAAGLPHSCRWRSVFDPLQTAIAQWKLPEQLLADLLSAFTQDVHKTRDKTGYANRAELLDYCQRSAAPVGRLLLHLYGVDDAQSLQHSDNICNALQLINFWQDVSLDLPRGRNYLPQDRYQIESNGDIPHQIFSALVKENVTWASDLMCSGAPLVHRVPGRAGWELRLVVQGGLRILDKVEKLGAATSETRPKLKWWDVPVMLWRALWM